MLVCFIWALVFAWGWRLGIFAEAVKTLSIKLMMAPFFSILWASSQLLFHISRTVLSPQEKWWLCSFWWFAHLALIVYRSKFQLGSSFASFLSTIKAWLKWRLPLFGSIRVLRLLASRPLFYILYESFGSWLLVILLHLSKFFLNKIHISRKRGGKLEKANSIKDCISDKRIGSYFIPPCM